MSNIFIVDLESVESRYTGQWKTHIPSLLTKQEHTVTVIDGPTDIPQATTPGAFLNFGGTNVYKAAQVEKIGRLFCDGRISSGDHFIFTDAWHPGIINLKYMSELLGIPVKIHALWHAGSYDPADFLGRLIGDAPWVRHAEKSFFYAIDHNYFATDFHINIFTTNLLNNGFHIPQWTVEDIENLKKSGKIIRTGWPMEYLPSTLEPYNRQDKSNLIVFPHRIAPEKQVEIFRDLENLLPQYDFIVCQDSSLTKHQYHEILSKAKIVFSCSLQETLGIGCYEGTLVDAIPMVPNRLSYKEMYYEGFKYPSEWTESWELYQTHKQQLCYEIIRFMDNYDHHVSYVKKQSQDLTNMFFSCDKLLKNLQ
jgi:hypothetical protein